MKNQHCSPNTPVSNSAHSAVTYLTVQRALEFSNDARVIDKGSHTTCSDTTTSGRSKLDPTPDSARSQRHFCYNDAPSVSCTSANSCTISFSTATLHWNGDATPPAAEISSTTCSAAAVLLRYTTATLYPAAASLLQVAAPIPRDPPVTTATLVVFVASTAEPPPPPPGLLESADSLIVKLLENSRSPISDLNGTCGSWVLGLNVRAKNDDKTFSRPASDNISMVGGCRACGWSRQLHIYAHVYAFVLTCTLVILCVLFVPDGQPHAP